MTVTCADMTANGSTSGVEQPRVLAHSSAVRPVTGSRTVTSARPSVANRAAHSRKPWRAATSRAVCRSALTWLILRPRRRKERIRIPMATSLPTCALCISGVLPEHTNTFYLHFWLWMWTIYESTFFGTIYVVRKVTNETVHFLLQTKISALLFHFSFS